jgi:TonB family protein
MRDYRQLSAEHQDSKPVEAAILFYAGWLGHYVGDGSQPLHATIQYNGWVGPNPHGYTTDHTIHWRFEGPFVDAAISAPDVQPLVTPVHPIGDEWDDYLAYLRHSNSLVERVYQLDKEHGFDGTGTAAAKQFTAERLAAGASMLRDLYVAAWVKSAEPVPDWHDQHAAGAPSAANGATATVDPEQIFRKPFPEGFKNPVLRYAPSPEFPDNLRRQKISGMVVVSVIVDKDGRATDVHAVSGDNKDLMKEAVKAVREYKFSPGTYRGQPVVTQIDVEVNFRID